VVEAATLEGVVDLARTVRGENHDRDVLGADRADLRHGHLEVGEQFQQERFQLLIGAVDLVDQQDRRFLVRGVDRLQEGALEQKFFREEIVTNRLAAFAAGRLDRTEIEHLTGIVPLVNGGGGVQPLVALQADERGIEEIGEDFGDLGLADAGLALQQEGFSQLQGKVEGGGEAAFGDIALLAQAALQLIDRGKLVTGGRGGLLGK
jgi:hypothetical protein